MQIKAPTPSAAPVTAPSRPAGMPMTPRFGKARPPKAPRHAPARKPTQAEINRLASMKKAARGIKDRLFKSLFGDIRIGKTKLAQSLRGDAVARVTPHNIDHRLQEARSRFLGKA